MGKFERKPFDQLSPSYRKRIERLEAKGYTRNQARGHTGKGELKISEVSKPLYEEKNWVLRQIRQIANQSPDHYNSKEVKELSKEYKKAIAAPDHHTKEVRDIFKGIREATKKYRPGEDLDFVVEGWY